MRTVMPQPRQVMKMKTLTGWLIQVKPMLPAYMPDSHLCRLHAEAVQERPGLEDVLAVPRVRHGQEVDLEALRQGRDRVLVLLGQDLQSNICGLALWSFACG